MDGFQPFTVRTCLSFLLLILLQTSAEAQLCKVPQFVVFKENNAIGDIVENIIADPGVKVDLIPSADSALFKIEDNKLIANAVLDFETDPDYSLEITCALPPAPPVRHSIIVILTDVNDEPPAFAEALYQVTVSEMTPVGTSVGRFAATDPDSPTLYYTLKPESSGFKLESETIPNLLIATLLDYDDVKNPIELILEVQDTPLGSALSTAPDTTTINVTIIDVDNRQPWFHPCQEYNITGVVTCLSSGYTSIVVLNQEPGVLDLKPNPLYAIDGDAGINAEITYSILDGDETGLFEINSTTGSISLLKKVDVLGKVILTVLASQKDNGYQFATTTVTISVQEESFHPPVFEKLLYEGVVAAAGTMVMNLNSSEPLQIVAKDEDYASVGSINPHITYSIDGNTAFIIIEGFLFMTTDLPETELTMKVVATDTNTSESATADLLVRVESGLTTTTTKVPLPTSSMATTTKGEYTTIKTTNNIGSTVQTTTSNTTTTHASRPTESGASPTKPSQTSQGSLFTTSTAQTHTGPTTTRVPPGTTVSVSTTTKGESTTKSNTAPGPTTTREPPGTTVSVATATKGESTTKSKTDSSPTNPGGPAGTTSSMTTEDASVPPGYELGDMLALGITLGVLLFICLVVIGLLIWHIQRRKQDWRKIYQTNVFRSSLGNKSGGQKEDIRYINKAFQNDEDVDNTSSNGLVGQSKIADGGPPVYETVLKSSVLLPPDLLPDNTSQAGSDKSDSEKEVKPILTKEKRMDEGYKAVWFKVDIDPDAKEEVVIIPDSREQDSEEEDVEQPSSSREEDDEDDNLRTRTRRVVFNDKDPDSGIGVKIEDPADDSEDDEVLGVDL